MKGIGAHNSMPQVRDRSGFTLIEVMVAAVIFGIVMLAGLAFFSYGMKPVARSGEATFALTIAQNKIEDVRTTCVTQAAYSDLAGTADTFTDPNSGVVFTRTMSPTAGPVLSTRRLTVTVTWKPGNDASASNKMLILTTLLARPY